MDLKEKNLLEETAALSKENNHLLKKLHRAMVVGRVMRVAYWVIIIGITLGLFYFLQPYLELLGDVYGNVQNTVEGAQEIFESIRGVNGTTTVSAP